MADRLYTSSEADEILSALRFEMRMEKAVLARIAFAVSLVQDGKNVPENLNFSGGELKRPTFFGPDELFIRSLLAHVHGKGDIAEDAFFSNRSLIKNHIDFLRSLKSSHLDYCKATSACRSIRLYYRLMMNKLSIYQRGKRQKVLLPLIPGWVWSKKAH